MVDMKRPVDPLSLGAVELAAAVRSGLSASEPVEASLDRCGELLGSTNALTELRSQARDEVGDAGPLAGVPVLVKDMFADGGRIPTVGSKVHASWATGTSTVLERLRAAGAVAVAYTNMHEWAIGTTSAVTATGPIENPRHPGTIAGGSSGGSAAALALGAAPLAIGSDAGGSIRIPAACCGVVGLKPTLGAVPLDGFALDGGPPIDHVGPMARSVADARLMFEVMADRTVGDLDVGSLTVGIPEAAFFEDSLPEVSAVYASVVNVVAGVARAAIRIDLAGLDVAPIAIAGSLLPYVAHVLRDDLERRPDDFQPDTLKALRFGAELTGEDRSSAKRQRDEVRDSFDRAFEEVDAIVTPTIPGPPPPLATQTVVLRSGPAGPDATFSRFNGPMNLAGVPALSVPVADDLSLTISAQRGREDIVLALGAALEDAFDRAYVNRII
jgi:aspartyl-tRNA(Asn)/glutamyl-tRNA(Gln) amidotransferase subunit A